ncbi:Protein of unknown function DUF599 [Dillenia turbinata]|uniref:O-methyltransferase domain-containing protein n=1 Tax=Dillenia turbinata TaxID=194707 RepID=A0AAN8ULA4_9MAGN
MDANLCDGKRELFQAQSHMYKHIFYFVSSMALKCAIQLGISDIIHGHTRPITLPELVSALQISPTRASCLQRLMRVLVRSGFFAERKVHENQEDEGYVLTLSSSLLVKDNSTSLSKFAQGMLDPSLVTPWHFLGDWFRGNELTPFETAHGMGFWDYADQSPQFNTIFNNAMTSDSQLARVVIQDCKETFEGLKSLVDVGGSGGIIAGAVSESFPHVQCTVFDLPHVIANVPKNKNLDYVGGDMFQSIPSADVILFKLVLHALKDDDCLKVLKCSREVIPSNGKVIIIDIVMNDNPAADEMLETKLFFDMLMMVVVTGRERSEKEWKKLFLEAGFSGYKIKPILGLRSLIEVLLYMVRAQRRSCWRLKANFSWFSFFFDILGGYRLLQKELFKHLPGVESDGRLQPVRSSKITCRKEQQRNTKMEHSEKKNAEEMLQAQSHIYKHVFNYIDSMTINCAVRLGVPDIILSHNQPMTLHELVTALGIPPLKATCLRRLMRLLVHSGFFAIRKLPGKSQEVGYDLTPSSRLLLKDNVNCLTAFLLAPLQPVLLTPWQYLGEWFKGKETTTFETAYGKNFWEYAEQDPDFSDMFNEAMECKTVFEGMGSLVDVGGGRGIVTRVISDAFPALRCTVFDLPQVVADLPETKNLKYVGGDMFQSVPSADAILLKHVLHNWSDDECVKILKKCREAIQMNEDKGKVLIIDLVIDIDQDEHHVTDTKLYFHMLMMVLVNGQERAAKEWEKLFFQAGFSRYTIKPIFGLRSLIEDNSKYASVAVTVISSNISAATYLASVSLTLSALIGAWLGSSYNDVFQSDIIYGDTRPSTINIKYISLLTCFLLAFYCFVQSAGFLVQANYLISIPDSNLTAEDVESALIKGSDFWSLGLRALFFAVTLLPWFFGPIPMFIMSILMILILHNLDRNPTRSRRSKSSGNGSVKKPLVSESQ